MAGAVSLIVDQSHMNHINSWHNLSYYKFDQEFSPSFHSLDVIELEIYTSAGAELQVNIRQGFMEGPIMGESWVLSLSPNFHGMTQFVFSSPISLVQDDGYVIDVMLLEGSASIASSFEQEGYSDGKMYINGINTPTDNSDVIFQTGLTQPDLIDIKTRSSDECINIKSANTVKVVINSSDIFDATMVDPATVSLAGAGVKTTGKNGKYHCKEGHVNNDELLDLVCSIDIRQLMIEEGEFTVGLEAETFDGISIHGEDTLCFVQY
jgi:hypothetical protein